MAMKRSISRYDFLVGLVLIIILVGIFWTDGWNCSKYQIIGYDEGYNATVAANLAKSGEYKISYPDDTVFYNRISTGATVIVPTSALYRFCGINAITTNLIPLLYGVLSIFSLYFLLAFSLKNYSCRYLLAALLSVGTVITDLYFQYVSTHLIGEGAAIFFLLLCFLGISGFCQKGKCWAVILAGGALAAAFLTKSSMIFCVITMFGILLIEMFFAKTMPIRQGKYFFFGFAVGFILFDAIKLFQLGSFNAYVKWWIAEWANMLSQSSGVDLAYSIRDKINYLPQIFGVNLYLCAIMILLPVCVYAIHVFTSGFLKKEIFKKYELSIIYSGVAGASLLVYFVLLGGSGLVYARRLSANAFLVRFSAGFLILIIAKKIGDIVLKSIHSRERTLICIGAGFLVSVILVYHPSQLMVGTKTYFSKLSEKEYEAQLMDEFLAEVYALPDSAVLYCWGWWQEPNVSLFLEREMTDLQKVDVKDIDRVNGYLIIGRRFDGQKTEKVAEYKNIQLTEIDHIDVNYNYMYSFNSNELYSIYKIN